MKTKPLASTETKTAPALPALPILDKQTVTLVATGDIVPSPFQPRTEFPEEEMAELRESIKEQGIQVPLTARRVKGKVELVGGERRWRCAKALKLAEVPVILRELTDDEALRIVRLEFAGRENLKALEAAEDYLALEKAGKSVEEICALYGVKRSHVFTRKRVAKLPVEIRKLIRESKLAITLADLAAKLPTAELQLKAAKAMTRGYDGSPMSFRDAERLMEREYSRSLSGAGWELDDAGLMKAAGPCSTCPKRSGNMEGCAGSPHVCTDVACFEAKQHLQGKRVLDAARAAGRRIIGKAEAEHSHDLTDAEETCWRDPKNRTWKQLAKAAGITPAVTLNRDGEAEEVFTGEDKKAILKENKIKTSTQSSGSDRAAQKKYQQKEKQFREVASSAVQPILEKLVTTRTMANIPGKLWPALAAAAYHSLDISAHDFVAKRRGLSKTINESRTALEKWFKQAHTTQDHVKMTVELLLCADWNNGGWQQVKWNPKFEALAKLAGVNLGKIATPPATKPTKKGDKK